MAKQELKALARDDGDKYLIIMDVDGVFNHYSAKEYVAYLASLIDADPAELLPKVLAHSNRLCSGEIELGEFNNEMLKTLGISGAMARWVDYYLEVTLNPETIRIARRLREHGHKIILMSNEDKTRNSAISGSLKSLMRIDYSFIPSKIGRHSKPSPEAYLAVVQAVSESEGRPISMREIVFIDDSPKNVKAASALGMHGLVFTSANALMRDLEAMGIRLGAIPQLKSKIPRRVHA